jgi:hypothetical protein
MLAGGNTTRPVSWHHMNAPSSPHASGGQACVRSEPLGCYPLTAHQSGQSKAPMSRDTPDEPHGSVYGSGWRPWRHRSRPSGGGAARRTHPSDRLLASSGCLLYKAGTRHHNLVQSSFPAHVGWWRLPPPHRPQGWHSPCSFLWKHASHDPAVSRCMATPPAVCRHAFDAAAPGLLSLTRLFPKGLGCWVSVSP